MSVKYDKYYADDPDALGPPTQSLLAFFKAHLADGANVLDVGCGQGRDALWLGRRGHRVVGIDVSTVGVAQLNARAAAQNLPITAQVASAEDYHADMPFDCVLCDRTLHMMPKPARLAVMATLANHVAPGGMIVVLDEAANMRALRDVLGATWTDIWTEKTAFAARRSA